MTLVLCADERGGLSFHSRRQSQDRLLREDLLKEAEGRLLWVDGYTKRQFSEPSERIRVSETPWLQAGEGVQERQRQLRQADLQVVVPAGHPGAVVQGG